MGEVRGLVQLAGDLGVCLRRGLPVGAWNKRHRPPFRTSQRIRSLQHSNPNRFGIGILNTPTVGYRDYLELNVLTARAIKAVNTSLSKSLFAHVTQITRDVNTACCLQPKDIIANLHEVKQAVCSCSWHANFDAHDASVALHAHCFWQKKSFTGADVTGSVALGVNIL